MFSIGVQIALVMKLLFSLAELTQFLQGGNPKLVIVVVRQRRSAFSHDFSRDGLGRQLYWIHTADESLEPLVGEGGLTSVQLYDPEKKKPKANYRPKNMLFLNFQLQKQEGIMVSGLIFS